MILKRIVIIFIGIALWCPWQVLAGEGRDGIREVIRARLSTSTPDVQGEADDPGRDPNRLVREFYARRDFQPAWTSLQAAALIEAVAGADREGLNPGAYDLDRIKGPLLAWGQKEGPEGKVTDEERALLDLVLTETFLIYGRDLSQGRMDPEEFFAQWVPHHRPIDVVQALVEALEGSGIEDTLKGLAPRHPSYVLTREELASFRRVAATGGWPVIPEGVRLRKGDRGRNVALLKKRLVMAGDLTPELAREPLRFDVSLEAAVRRFQWRHGLTTTGIMNPDTRAALNVSVGQRIRQLEINMERWRWLPDDFGPRYVMTIIPDFWLYVVDDQKTVLSMKTVIGTPKQPSPVFSDEISYLELNPTWGLPNSIVSKEIIPKVKQDPDYLKKKRIRIYRNWSENAKEIDPKKINWAKMDPEKFPYRLIQDSGVNPLGRIKFMFPNEFDVYLHDTSEKYLFQRHRRLFSHGCIRVEKPYDLGEWALRDDPAWSRERLLLEIRKGKRMQVPLQRTVPVHVMYLTAWVDGNGLLQFRQDYYGYDKIYEEALAMSGRTRNDRNDPSRGDHAVGMLFPVSTGR